MTQLGNAYDSRIDRAEARIQELEAALDEAKKWNGVAELRSDLLAKENAELVTALNYYASGRRFDYGDRAQEALAKTGVK